MTPDEMYAQIVSNARLQLTVLGLERELGQAQQEIVTLREQIAAAEPAQPPDA